MSSWIDILKKNDLEFEINKKIENKENEDETISIEEYDPFIKDVEEEFYLKYIDKLVDIKIDFEKYIKDKGLPFFNQKKILENKNDINITYHKNTYDIYDYIKYNCNNYINLREKINEENNNYIKEMEEEEEYAEILALENEI